MNERQLGAHMARLAAEVGRQEQALYTNPVKTRRRRANPAIDSCATGNCQKQPLGSVSGEERPWWFWLAVGAGIGGFAYVASRSGMARNPGDGDMDSPEIAARAAAIAVQAGIPTILWGSPGVGKTSWLEALGKAMNAKVFTVIGSTKDPADIGGMMMLTGDLTPPRWAREIRDRSLAGLRSVLFLDEFSSMAPLVHAALLRVVRDKIAGECDFDPKFDDKGKITKYGGNAVHVVCAANPRGEGAAAIDLPPPAANRMLHIDWPIPSAVDWAIGIMSGFPLPRIDSLPSDWRKMPDVRRAKKEVAAFLSVYGVVIDLPSKSEDQGRAWPSPRSWEMAAEALGAARIVDAPRAVEVELVSGAVGVKANKEFFTWYDKSRTWSQEHESKIGKAFTDTDAIEKVEKFSSPDHLFAIGQQFVDKVATSPSKQNWDQAWDFIKHVVKMSMTEGGTFNVAPLAVMASDLLDMLLDEKISKKLKDAKLPPESLLEALDYEGIQVRARK